MKDIVLEKEGKKLTLKELQEAFYKTIFEPKDDSNEALYRKIDPLGDLSGEQVVDIYRNSILGGLTEALANIYPVCFKLVGETFFNHMVAGYLRAYPSGSPDLSDYGAHVSSYIREFDAAKELVYLPDTAELEWCWHRAFNAADTLEEHTVALDKLSEIPEQDQGRIRFYVDPSVFLVQSQYPIHRIWEVNQDDYEGDQAVNLDDGAVSLVVWRNVQFGMRIDVLTDDEFSFLNAVGEGKTFFEIAQLPCASTLIETLGRCLQTGLLVGFTLID